MIDRKTLVISGSLIAALFASALVGWALRPDQPVKIFFLAPLIGLAMWGFQIALRSMDHRREPPLKAESRLFYLPALLTGTLQFFALSRAFGKIWGTPGLVIVAVGLFWMIMGNTLGKLRPGHPLGMRNPWTSSDPLIWDKAHRVGGRLIVLAGAGAIAAGLLLPIGWPTFMVVLALPVTAVLAILCYSWMAWRRLHPGEPSLPMNGGALSMAISLVVLITISADFALEQGRSGVEITALALPAILVARFVCYRRQRH